ncbi:MAG: cytochrome d ubiquinol oxidase subunit II [Chlamydiales bacterium]|nr:cytochrome d ubiquinol oxidase subunit II [Chlamydiales bacterium]
MTDFLLQTFSYLVVCAAVVCYCLLDGFDLGVGALHLFVKTDKERRIFLNAIGPLWDGNEVWFVIVGGALFVAFPPAYGTLLSAFYTPVMILLAGLIFRAVAIEFRSKQPSQRWRFTWDALFSIASIVIIFCVGTVLGNLIRGIEIDQDRIFTGSFWSFFHFYPVIIGIMAIALFMMHGLVFLLMKTEGSLHDKIRTWISPIMIFFAITYIIVSIMTMMYVPHMIERMQAYPVLYLVPLLTLGFIVLVPVLVSRKYDGTAFGFSCAAIIGLFSLFGIGTFPDIIRSITNPNLYSITFMNASAGRITLEVFLTIVVIGIPLVFAYGIWIYRVFRGKVKIDSSSY